MHAQLTETDTLRYWVLIHGAEDGDVWKNLSSHTDRGDAYDDLWGRLNGRPADFDVFVGTEAEVAQELTRRNNLPDFPCRGQR